MSIEPYTVLVLVVEMTALCIFNLANQRLDMIELSATYPTYLLLNSSTISRAVFTISTHPGLSL